MVPWLIVLLSSVGCASPQAPFQLPVQMRGIQLDRVRPDFAAQSVEMTFRVRFRLHNPTSSDIPIPPHAGRFELDGTPVGAVTLELDPGAQLPGHGSLDLAYRVDVDTGALSPEERAALLGRDVPYRFAADLALPLPPEAASVASALGWNPSLELAFEDTIRVPLLPRAALVAAPQLELVGGDLTVVERDFDLGLLEGLRDASATFVYGAAPGSAQQKADARDDWLAFFDAVVATDVRLVQLEPVTGLRMRLPLRITNPNQFEIALPSLEVDFDAGSRNVWTLRQSPSTATLGETGTPGDARDVTWVSTFHFDGLDDLAIPASERTLEVDTTVDLGHGRIELPLRVP